MDYRAQVREVAAQLNLLNGSGDLIPLDSLSVVDLVVELESLFKVRIPLSKLGPQMFKDLDSVTTMVASLAQA